MLSLKRKEEKRREKSKKKKKKGKGHWEGRRVKKKSYIKSFWFHVYCKILKETK